jgi:tetratricopeptide (TPR) repeat protein
MVEQRQSEKSVFLAAVDIESDAERAAFVEQACAGNPQLRAEVDALLQAHGRPQPLLDAAPTPGPTVAHAVREAPGVVIGPYKLIESIGEGGMGSVWMAQQTEPVKRLVAVKLIKAGMDSKAVIARFEAERQALALMDHPNIARVLDGGTTKGEPGGVSPGRPYFVMDLVKGVAITRYCDEHRLTPRQRLELFIPVCQAIQHAHQKGIIHRDLKPSNVLVALYDGKPVPKVIDFGVAKAAGQTLTEKTLVTGFGSLVGTLEYMSPEQAEINQLDIDTRSDIYSLGVLLYELLTGSPPFSKKELEKAGMLEMLRVIREQEPSKPSTKLSTAEGLPTLAANRGTEPAKLTKLVRGELDWIVMKALEKDRNRRYETANGFAQDLQRYLADEPVQACPPSAAYRLRKFARRNKVSLGIAGLILFFIALLGGGAGWMVRDRAERQRKLNSEIELAVGEAGAARDRALALTDNPYQWEAALAGAFSALKRAQGLASPDEAALEPAVRERLQALNVSLQNDDNDRRFVTRFDEIRLELFEIHKAGERVGESKVEIAFPAFKEAFQMHYAIAFGETPLAKVQSVLRERPPPVRDYLVAALEFSLAYVPKNERQARQWLSAALQTVDSDPWRKRALAAIKGRDWKGLDKLVNEATAAGQSPVVLIGLATRYSGDGPSMLDLWRRIRRAYPADFGANAGLAGVLLYSVQPPRLEEAIRYYTAASVLRPHNPLVYASLATAFRWKGDLDEAIALYRQAVAVAPSYPQPHEGLGLLLFQKGRFDEGIAELRAITRLRNYVPDYITLGNMLAQKGRVDEVIAVYKRAIKLDPKDTIAHRRGCPEALAIVHYNLGLALQEKNKQAEAIRCYRKAIELNPKYAPAHNNLGNVLRDQKKLGEAIACYRKAIELDPKLDVAYHNLGCELLNNGQVDEAIACFQKAVELDPKSAQAHYNLGVALAAQGKLDQAIACYKKAIELDPRYAGAHYALGNALRDRHKLEEAIASYRKAIELDPKCSKAHNNLGNALGDQGKRDEAIICYKKAIELDPKNRKAHNNLGLALKRQGQLAEAVACYRRAIALDPKYSNAHSNLGEALRLQNKLDEAIACYKKAIELDPKDAAAHISLGAILCDFKRDYDGAIACFRKALDLEPKNARIHYNLGLTLHHKGQVDEAIACYRQAIALNPKHAGAHNNLGKALKRQGKLDEAITYYKKAIALDPKHAWAHNNLGNALRDQGNRDEAVACYRRAIALDPLYARAYANLGDALQEQGKLEEAVACYRKLIELDPKDTTAYYTLGGALMKQGKWGDAITYLSKAVKLDPKDAEAQNNLGCALQVQGQLDEAVASYRKAIAINPKCAPAHYNLGNVLNDQGKPDEAITCYKKAIELAPKNPKPHLNLGVALMKQGKLDAAIASLRKGIELDPKNAKSHSNLGYALYRQKQFEEAIAAYRKALKLDPKFALAHERLALALNDLARGLTSNPDAKPHDPGKAVALAEEAVRLAPKAGNYWNTLGVAHYRASKWKKALASLDKSVELRQGGDGFDWFFLAMTHWKLANKDEARKWYDKGVQWMEKHAKQNEELRLFRSEAQALLEIKKK